MPMTLILQLLYEKYGTKRAEYNQPSTLESRQENAFSHGSEFDTTDQTLKQLPPYLRGNPFTTSIAALTHNDEGAQPSQDLE